MRQKQEWYDEDRLIRKEQADEIEGQMKREAKEAGFYGKLKIGE